MVEASGAAVVDAEAGIVFEGDLRVENASLLVGAPRINLGDAPADAEGFSVDAETLAGLGAAELRLRDARGSICMAMSAWAPTRWCSIRRC